MCSLQPIGTRDYFLGEELFHLEMTTIKQCVAVVPYRHTIHGVVFTFARGNLCHHTCVDRGLK
jgi:hypothetical protein